MKLPKAYETMKSGTVRRWFATEGSTVAKGDLILAVESEEAVVEIESAVSGTLLRILVPDGGSIPVNGPIAVIGDPGEDVAEVPAKPVIGEPTVEATGGDREVKHAVVPILMPQAGQSMEEGTIVKWHVEPGDRIRVGQIIFEVETDKATVEVEADCAGRLSRIVVPEGETVPVKVPVAYLAENDADLQAYLKVLVVQDVAPAKPIEAPSAAPAAVPPTTPPVTSILEGVRIKASPAARKIARELGIDLQGIGIGSGPGGRILLTDVHSAKAVPGEPARRGMSAMRKAIARNVTASKQTIPHFYMRLTIDAEPILAFYQPKKAEFPCSINDVVVLACARTLREFPAFRSRLDGDKIVEFPTANIGIAVGMEDGLAVPVLVAADRMSFQEIAREVRRIMKSALGGKVANMGQGVLTISNLGMFGVEEFAAIINPPEAAILAVGAVREEPVVSNGAVRPGKVMTMTLSCDHRIIDGLLAAKFLARLKEILESPSLWTGVGGQGPDSC